MRKLLNRHSPSGADDQIRVRQVGGIEIVAKHLFGEIIRIDAIRNYVADRIQNLSPSPVVEGDIENDAVIVFCDFQGMANLLLQFWIDTAHSTAVSNLHSVSVEFVQLAFDGQTQQAHETGHLFQGALPVFGRECVDGQRLDATFHAAFQRFVRMLSTPA